MTPLGHGAGEQATTVAPLRGRRFWIEAGLAGVSLVGLVATLAVKDWIELVFRIDPDGGNGSLEWVVVAGFALATALFSILAHTELRRARARVLYAGHSST